MNAWLLTGAVLVFGAALVHTLVGEKVVLRRLFRHGHGEGAEGRRATDDPTTRRAVRLAWHSLSVALVGFAGLFVVAGLAPDGGREAWAGVLALFAATFVALAILSLLIARGRHVGWMWYAAVAATAWLGA